MEYITPMRYTVSRREAISAFTGMGRDSIRSLSLDRNRQEKVLNTLPKVPNRIASTPISAKYSQSMPAADKGPHRATESMVNIPPSIPIIMINRRI